ncbi:hypothetical protein [Streptomyces luteireticuli]|uniref:hypothetical protein n=1 Tax=Streptomyces luteireticuli TaxID=173858 RepID=UPI0035585B54
MSNRSISWFHSLTDSVFALGAAARETRLAHQAAQVAMWNVEPARLQYEEGHIRTAGRHIHQVHPHAVALGKIHDLCAAHEQATATLYRSTARMYAYGTAMAVLAVINSQQPRCIEFERDEFGEYVTPMGELPDLAEALGAWAGNERLAELRRNVIACVRAAEAAEELASDENLAGHEMARLTEARSHAAGLANSSYAYGEQAEKALHFLLINARKSDLS